MSTRDNRTSIPSLPDDAAHQGIGDVRRAVAETAAAAVAELRRLGSPHAELVEECFAGIDGALRAVMFGDSLRTARELAAAASERARKLSK